MDCEDCGNALDESSFVAKACQNCGESLFPEDLENLRIDLGIDSAAPPELEIPTTQGDIIELPDFIQCPNVSCQAPLMNEELVNWNSGGSCPYCGQESFDVQSTETEVLTESTELNVPVETSITLDDSIDFILNCGNKIGKLLKFPLGIIGRGDLKQMISDSSYSAMLEEVSREHIKLERTSGIVGIIDLGTSNGTYINQRKIFGVRSTELCFGDALQLSNTIGLSLSSRSVGSFSIVHHPSMIRMEYPPEHPEPIHLGRLTLDETLEPWVALAMEEMNRKAETESEDLEYISRRHLWLQSTEDGFLVWHEKGKAAWGIEVEGQAFQGVTTDAPQLVQSPFRLKLGKNEYSVDEVAE